MKKIPLTQGKVAIVDDCDYEWLMQWKWQYSRYAQRMQHVGMRPRRRTVSYLMHREILKRKLGHANFDQVDHINRDRLDNRRTNLRVATSAQNGANSLHTQGLTGFQGVTWDKASGKWLTLISVQGKRIYLGKFNDLIDAVRARKKAEQKYHGEFAVLNETKE